MKIALTLSGGALRAAAQIGALRFLEERGVEIAAVSGSSAGSVVALLIASGWESRRIEGFLRSLRKRDLFRLSRGAGIFSLDGVERLLRRELGHPEYGDLKIPCITCVTELESARSHYLDAGDPIGNVVASCALTPIFSPRKVGKLWCIDGGFSDNLPVRPLKDRGYRVLSLNVNPLEGGVPETFRSLLMRSLMIMLNSNIRPSRELSDVHLEIEGVARMHLFDFSALDKALESGYRELKSAWPEIERHFRSTRVL